MPGESPHPAVGHLLPAARGEGIAIDRHCDREQHRNAARILGSELALKPHKYWQFLGSAKTARIQGFDSSHVRSGALALCGARNDSTNEKDSLVGCPFLLFSAAAEGGQAMVTLVACRPLGPRVTSNSTAAPSAKVRKPLP